MRSSLLQSPLANIKIIANGTKRKEKNATELNLLVQGIIYSG
jgi:hypothetical protein